MYVLLHYMKGSPQSANTTNSGVPQMLLREFMSSFNIFKNHLGVKCPCCLDKVFPARTMLNFIVQHYYDTEIARKAGESVYNWVTFATSGSIKDGTVQQKT